MNESLQLNRMETPLGVMLIVTDEQEQLWALDWLEYRERMQSLLVRHARGAAVQLCEGTGSPAVTDALQEYFDGKINAINSVVVSHGGTEFQQLVWSELRRIPCGETISYRELAARIGRPNAIRAVGAANGANPIGIVVPCHRVIGSNQALTGYGGGLNRKSWLLEHERKWAKSFK